MPLPFILAGAAAIAGGYGVKKGLDAKSDLDSAKSINRSAQRIFDEAQSDLESARNETQEAMSSLGELKFKIYQESMIPFAETFKQIKNIDFKDSNLTDGNLVTSEQQLEAITSSALEMKELVSGGIASLGTGGLAGLAAYGGVGLLGTASTGTAIGTLSGAAATNATLAWLGGGSLAAGGYGMAGGMAVLGGLVAGPVLAVGGMMLASKAEAAKEDARANLHKAQVAVEEMKTAVAATNAIQSRFIEIANVITALNNRFEPLLGDLQKLVSQNQDYTTYSIDDQKGVHICASLAKTIKNVLETPLIDQSGAVTSESQELLNELHLSDYDVSSEELSSPEPSASVSVAREPFSKAVSRVELSLHDGKYLYAGSEAYGDQFKKKMENARKSYAYDDNWDELCWPEILIDTTVFGSAKDGFYITDDEIAVKPFLGDRFYIKFADIRSIEIDDDERNIIINEEELAYIHSELDESMHKIVKMIKLQINQ